MSRKFRDGLTINPNGRLVKQTFQSKGTNISSTTLFFQTMESCTPLWQKITPLNASISQLAEKNWIWPLCLQPTHQRKHFQKNSHAKRRQISRACISYMEVRIMSLTSHSRNSRTMWCLFWSAQLGCRTRNYSSAVTETVVYILQGASIDPAKVQSNLLENWRGTKANTWHTCSTQEKKIILKFWWLLSAQPLLRNKDRRRVKHYWQAQLEHSTMKPLLKSLDANSKPHRY